MSESIYKNVICPDCGHIGVVRRIEWLAWQCPSCELIIHDIYGLGRHKTVNTHEDDKCECGISKEDLDMVDKCNNHDCSWCSPVYGCHSPEDYNCQDDITQDDDTNELPYRLEEWFNFDEAVCKHIEEYTIPQYGDYPQDLLTTTTNECIVHDMKRYLNRFGKGQRGYKEAMRDMLKVAQYAGVLYNRLQLEFETGNSHFKPEYVKEQDTIGYLDDIDWTKYPNGGVNSKCYHKISKEWNKDNSSCKVFGD